MQEYVDTKIRLIFFLVVVLTLNIGIDGRAATIRCASTTSTQNSGLFDYILPLIEKESGIIIQVIAVGTGAALALGRKGDVDLVLVHAKDLELQMVEEGWFMNRKDLMYNDFVIVGPESDPADLKNTKTAVESFIKIRSSKSLFVSRGDDSGTHKKELSLWKLGNFLPDSVKNLWYLSVGQGMAKTVRIAAEKRAYTLVDRGTWLALKDRDSLNLIIAFEGDSTLFNQYGVMAVNPEKHPHIQIEDAEKVIRWLVSEKGQAAIGSYVDKRGNALFVPNAR